MARKKKETNDIVYHSLPLWLTKYPCASFNLPVGNTPTSLSQGRQPKVPSTCYINPSSLRGTVFSVRSASLVTYKQNTVIFPSSPPTHTQHIPNILWWIRNRKTLIKSPIWENRQKPDKHSLVENSTRQE